MSELTEAEWADIARTPPKHISECIGGIMEVSRAAATLHPLCESPIEKILGVQLILLFSRFPPEFKFGIGEGDTTLRLIPQFQWNRFRMDFAVKYFGRLLFIECDGQEFHATSEQIANDRRKDAAAFAAGIRLFRFTGKEIWGAAPACALTIVDELSRLERAA